MIDLNNIKTILQVAGISRLKIAFDNDHNLVNVDYVFRGETKYKQVTYQEIVESLTIGQPGPSVGPGVALAPRLSELPGEN